MTRGFIFATFLLLISIAANAQAGMHAGSYKKWVKIEVEKHKEKSFFKGFQLASSMLVSEENETEYSLQVYEKGTTCIVLLITQIKDALSYIIQDVVEIKNVLVKDNIQSGSCSLHGNYNAKIFVLEKNINGKPKNIKAWYADTDKLRFIGIPVKGINCIVEGGD
jgi:hypothetical protein